MKKEMTLAQAMEKLEALRKENRALKKELEALKEENEALRSRKLSGRKKHNAKWMAIYDDFVLCHESGMPLAEIARKNAVSERTMYRYKAYYEMMKKRSE